MALNVKRGIARKLAKEFGLRPGEEKVFNKAWNYQTHANDFHKELKKDGNLDQEITRAFDIFESIIKRGSVNPNNLGHAKIREMPTEGKYVIFSDHHWSYFGHRQNFFGEFNQQAYIDALRQYLGAGYTLIENGDVEELLVLDPAVEEEAGEDIAEMFSDWDTWMKDWNANAGTLHERRLGMRLSQFRRILDDPENQPLYDVIGTFLSRGRYIKVAGNHDYDIQKPEFLNLLNAKLAPNRLEQVDDYVLLKSGNHVDYAIMHGHQFDVSTNPVNAPRIGEVVSEGLSWAYQGADRNWEWNDHVDRWAMGLEPFNNNLVSDEYNRGSKIRAGLQAAGIADPIATGAVAVAVAALFPGAAATAAGVAATVGLFKKATRSDWESLFMHNIAWEYFETSDPVKEEVNTGDEFFKFRHLDEQFIAAELTNRFGNAERPKLVLGHSHEVRIDPGFSYVVSPYPNSRLMMMDTPPQAETSDNTNETSNNTNETSNNTTAPPPQDLITRWESFSCYLNSGSAGRFQNLIWGIEIDHGVARVVAWHWNESEKKAKRHICDSATEPNGEGRVLRARRTDEQLEPEVLNLDYYPLQGYLAPEPELVPKPAGAEVDRPGLAEKELRKKLRIKKKRHFP